MFSLPEATGQCLPGEGENGQGVELSRGGRLTSGGEAASRRRTKEHHCPPHFLPLSWSFPQRLHTRLYFFCFVSQSDMVFMQGLVMKWDEKPERVFRTLLGGLEPPPGKATQSALGS